MRYWVVGGEYTDTSFRAFAPGKTEERYGPYDSYHEAYQAWSARARATIDDATIRYRIQSEDRSAA
jgi:hypothetical protein